MWYFYFYWTICIDSIEFIAGLILQKTKMMLRFCRCSSDM